MNKLRGAVIGVGYLGRFHAQKINAHAEANLVGVCDYSFTQAQTVAAELGTTAYQKPEELFGKVDFVHIAASTQAHYDLAASFLNQKIPVLVEKPIAATVDQAKKLCDLAAKNQTLLTAGHIERFNPAFQFLKERKAGASYLEINRLAPFKTRGSDVSVLHDLMIHDIDLVNWLFNEKIIDFEISGRKLIKPTYDDVSVRLKLASGLQVTINNSRVTPQIVRNFRVIKKDEIIYVNTATLEAEILKPTSADPFHEVEKLQLPKADSLALEVDHFIQCLLGRKQLAITAQEATFALEMIENFITKLDSQAKAFA
ncbi:MAG: Gfo/Idh/MocA family oxidoreductase [Bdellovibrio sp.]|nr:Gfo/Idh/MocA family oxidoreductase [Bdellovibrio sp.]